MTEAGWPQGANPLQSSDQGAAEAHPGQNNLNNLGSRAQLRAMLRTGRERLAECGALLERPDRSSVAGLVTGLEESCRLLNEAGLALRQALQQGGQDNAAQIREQLRPEMAEWRRSVASLRTLVEGARRFCDGWACVSGIEAGYSTSGQDLGSQHSWSGSRVDRVG